jgi:hypothetical protein
MTVRGIVTDVYGGYRVAATNGRQRASPQSVASELAGDDDIPCRADGRKDLSLESVAAPWKEKRRARRHCQRLALVMSVFNQGAVFKAQMVNYGEDGICAETAHHVLPGTSLHMRIDTRQAAEVGKAVWQGLKTTELGEVKWCRTLGQGRSLHYHMGIRYYSHY